MLGRRLGLVVLVVLVDTVGLVRVVVVVVVVVVGTCSINVLWMNGLKYCVLERPRYVFFEYLLNLRVKEVCLNH